MECVYIIVPFVVLSDMAVTLMDGKPYARFNVLVVEADLLPDNDPRRT